MDILELGWGVVDWIGLAEDRDSRRALEPSGSIKCWETIKWLHKRERERENWIQCAWSPVASSCEPDHISSDSTSSRS
jgi:hypothetical protein